MSTDTTDTGPADTHGLPADDTPMAYTGVPVANPAFPFILYNAHALPALLTALAEAQAGYAHIVKDKQVEMIRDGKPPIRFKYADMAALLDAVIPSLSKYGLSFIQPINQDGDSTWLHSILAHKGGCVMVTRIKLHGGELKVFGAEITYIRRYMAGPMLGVSAEDDLDEGGDGSGGDYGSSGYSRDRDDSSTRPARPRRRSASSGGDDGGSTGDGGGSTAAAAAASKITAGQLTNLQNRIKAAGLEPPAIAAMLERLQVPAIDANMTLEHWKIVRADVDKAL